jgi:hypothetical protein
MDWDRALSEGILSGMTAGVFGIIGAICRWTWLGFKSDLEKWKARRVERMQKRVVRVPRSRVEPPIRRIEPPVRR